MIINSPSATLAESAERSAPNSILRGSLYAYERGCGPCTVPPCRHRGDRMEPTRARPVPFCRHNFFPEPETSLRFLVAWVPALWAARYCFTASQSRSSFTAPKISSARSNLPTLSPLRFKTSIVAISLLPMWCGRPRPRVPSRCTLRMAARGSEASQPPSLLFRGLPLRSLQRVNRARAGESAPFSGRLLRLVNQHVAAVRAGHAAFHHQQVLFLVNSQHPQVAHRDPVGTHVSRHPHALEHTRRKRGGADRTGNLEHRAV